MKEKEAKMAKTKKSWKQILIRLGVFLGILIAIWFAFNLSQRMRLLKSIVYFTENTMKEESYILYDVDIMEVLSDYFNGETMVYGKMGLSRLRDLKASMSVEVNMKRSMERKEFEAESTLSVLWIKAGNVNVYGQDETIYITAPMLSADFGYAFPTGLNLFPKMPELTSDISREWFHDNYFKIVKLMTEIGIEKSGERYEDENGLESEEFVITIPKGSGDFIWELLGMEAPDYDVVVKVYLTKENQMARCVIPLDHALPGAYIMLDGLDASTLYMYYDLPDAEFAEMTMVRNPDHHHVVDCKMTYHTNVGQDFIMTNYVTWESDDQSASLAIKEITMYRYDRRDCTTESLGEGYFEGTVSKIGLFSEVTEDENEFLQGLEVIDWRTLRNDTDMFVQGIMDKLAGRK